MKSFIQKLMVGPIIFISIMGFIYIGRAFTSFLESLSWGTIKNILNVSFVIFLLSIGFINDLLSNQEDVD